MEKIVPELRYPLVISLPSLLCVYYWLTATFTEDPWHRLSVGGVALLCWISSYSVIRYINERGWYFAFGVLCLECCLYEGSLAFVNFGVAGSDAFHALAGFCWAMCLLAVSRHFGQAETLMIPTETQTA